MLNADQAPHFHSCPRCGAGGLERLRTHGYCVNCNYEEHYGSDVLCSIPNWALDALKTVRPKSIVRELRPVEREESLEYAAV